MNVSEIATLKVLALSGVSLALALAACSGDEPESAGPVPTVSAEREQSASATNRQARPPGDPKRIGFIGLPPEGATPSTPERGELVISYRGHLPARIIWTKNRNWGKAFAWVYDDGRLIWHRDDDRRYGANHISTGYLEQRLTPEGVELFRSALIATGIFEGRRPDSITNPRRIEVRDGDRLLSAGTGFGGHAGDREGTKLAALFTDPTSWLPASAWEDRNVSAYVPSKFAVCLWGMGIEPSRVSALLPAAARELLRGRPPANPSSPFSDSSCSEVTTQRARVLDDALTDAGLERWLRAEQLAYRLNGPAREPSAVISFTPYLPHGKWVSTVGD